MPAETREITSPVPDSTGDTFLYRLLIGGLIAFAVTVVVVCGLLAWVGKAVPDGLLPLAGVAIGGLILPLGKRTS